MNQTLLDEVSRLNPDELDRLSQHIKALRSLSTATREVDDDVGFVMGCLASVVLTEEGVQLPKPMLDTLAKSKAFQAKVPYLMQFFRNAHKDRRVQRALLRMGFETLYDDMTDKGYVCSPKTMVNHAHRIPSLLNRDYPGYARAGILWWVVKGRKT